MRDYLVSRLMIENIQRPGPIYQMTMFEYCNMENASHDKFTIDVVNHKTANTSGPAKIHMDSQFKDYVDKYIKFMRPKPQSKDEKVSLNIQGGALNSSSCYTILKRHIKKCNTNTWRAGNSAIQNIGD